MAASSNFETYEEDDSKPEAISSEAAASVLPISNATSKSNEELVTGMEFVGFKYTTCSNYFSNKNLLPVRGITRTK